MFLEVYLNNTKEELRLLPFIQIQAICESLIVDKNINEAWNCLEILTEQLNQNLQHYPNLLNSIIRYVDLLKNHTIHNDKLLVCRDWLKQNKELNPSLQNITINNFYFQIALAECYRIVGPRDLAIQLYLDIANFGVRCTDLYHLAELFLLDSRPITVVIDILEIAIQKDKGKYWIKDELINFIKHKSSLTYEELKEITLSGFNFSNDWFKNGIPIWNKLLPDLKPQRILEVGSYEGASATYLIELLSGNGAALEIHCVDTWSGSEEHIKLGIDFVTIEKNFDRNIALAAKNKANLKIYKHKGFSDEILSKFLSSGRRNYFDFIYIDGSHQAPDVLCDAVLAFRLLKIGGVLGFDDYMWMNGEPHERNIFNCPKPAIDNFINIYFRKITFLGDIPNNGQVYIKKYSD